MAEKTKTPEIEYTAEELAEIDRIVDSLPGSNRPEIDSESDLMSLSDDSSSGTASEAEDENETPDEIDPFADDTALDELDLGSVPENLTTDESIRSELEQLQAGIETALPEEVESSEVTDDELEPLAETEEIEAPLDLDQGEADFDIDNLDTETPLDMDLLSPLPQEEAFSPAEDREEPDPLSETDFSLDETSEQFNEDAELSLPELADTDLVLEPDELEAAGESETPAELQDISDMIVTEEEVPESEIDEIDEAFTDESSAIDEKPLSDLGELLGDVPDFESTQDELFDDAELPDLDQGEELTVDDAHSLDDEFSPVDDELDSLSEDDLGLPHIDGLDEEEEIAAEDLAETLTSTTKGSTLEQLDQLTSDEPESVDASDISDEAFVDTGEPEQPEQEEVPEVPAQAALSIEGDAVSEDLPDLDSLDIESDGEGIAEGDLGELPEMELDSFDADLDGLSGDELGSLDSVTDLDELPGEESGPISEMGEEFDSFDDSSFEESHEQSPADELPPIEQSSEVAPLEPIEDFGHETADIPDFTSDLPEIEPVDEGGSTPNQGSRPHAPGEPLELSDDELRRVKKALLLMPSGLTDAIKDTVLHDRIASQDMRRLIDMVLQGRPEDNIHRFLEKKLGQKIDKEAGGAGRRIIHSRPEYSPEGRERQKILLRRTRNIAIGAVAAIVLFVSTYNLLYIPMRAKQYIKKGTDLIRRFNEPKFPDYKEAEEIFQLVDTKYKKDFVYGYNEYGKAYFDKKQYMRSLQKLNRAYDIGVKENFSTKESVRTLNTLGQFYSQKKSPNFDNFFNESVKLNLGKYYHEKVPPLREVNTQYDLALDFFLKALNKDPKNVDAMLGIGDVYMNQGLYLQARNYYDNILTIDKNSIAGHSGLLNLFIERDNFSETVTQFVTLRDKNLLTQVSSPLLAKLAGYFLSKSKSDTSNIRIDYGIQSPRLKDSDDQPFPAVVETLKALRKKEPDYPPLYVQYARLSLKQKNYKLAREYLENGLRRAEKRGETFFDGNHLLGEFYYYTKQPAKAYQHFTKAIDDRNQPPAYTFHPYFKSTQEVGDTYAMIGNIFYYFFDQVKFTTGDQEQMSEVEVRKNEEMMGNFTLAEEKYIDALQAGYSVPEIHYNLGRIYYLKREYGKARDQWLNLYDEFTVSPELMMGLGNVFYRMGNYDAAKAQFMKMVDVYEFEAEKIRTPIPSNRDHQKIFRTLSSAYNNLGAVHQVQEDLDRSAISYWNSIEISRKLGEESEFARVNLNRGVKERKDPVEPILDDNIPYSIEYFKEDMRWN